MNTKSEFSFSKVFKMISKVLSWAIFVILVIAAVFLLYYFIATKIYAAKGPGYEPKFSIYTIISGSMEDTISIYDTIVNVRVDDPKNIAVGDVITFVSNGVLTSGMTTTHRVIGITQEDGETCYVTQGDANPVPDSTCAKYSSVIGKVFLKIPQLGQIQFFIASKAGWLLCVLVPALIVIIRGIMRMLKLSTINEVAKKMEEEPKKDIKKESLEKARKAELKKKLLKEDNTKTVYYEEPEIKVIDKRKNISDNKNSQNNNSSNNKIENKNNGKNKKKGNNK